jgi:hypothetical protein
MDDTPCSRKRAFKTERAARHELRRLRRSAIDWQRLAVYRCDRHNGWHIGNHQFSLDSKRVLKPRWR